jgi:hypothetical protein
VQQCEFIIRSGVVLQEILFVEAKAQCQGPQDVQSDFVEKLGAKYQLKSV